MLSTPAVAGLLIRKKPLSDAVLARLKVVDGDVVVISYVGPKGGWYAGNAVAFFYRQGKGQGTEIALLTDVASGCI